MELEELKKAQAELEELNALAKARAEADADLRIFQKMQVEYQPVEPLEAKLAPNHNLEKIADGLKDIAQDMSEYHAEYNENRRADEVKAEKEKKHSFRHDFLVAAFTVTLTLFFEHIHDIVEFISKFFRSLF